MGNVLTTLRRLAAAQLTRGPVHRAGHLKGQPVRESGAVEALGMGEPTPDDATAFWRGYRDGYAEGREAAIAELRQAGPPAHHVVMPMGLFEEDR